MTQKSKTRSPSPPDPSSFLPYDHAAAGHDGVQASGDFLAKPCTAAEVGFYASARQHQDFHKHLPLYIGTITPGALDQNQLPTLAKNIVPEWVPSGGKKLDTGLCIILENVTAGFKKPNVIDLKLGSRLYADDAPAEKRRKLEQVSEETTSGSLGFRVAGMKVYRPQTDPTEQSRYPEHVTVENDGYVRYSKHYGKAISAENISEAFVDFFGGAKALKKPHGTAHVVERLAAKIRSLVESLKTEEIRIYSASILMVYEVDEDAMRGAVEAEKAQFAANGNQTAEHDAGVNPVLESGSEQPPLSNGLNGSVLNSILDKINRGEDLAGMEAEHDDEADDDVEDDDDNEDDDGIVSETPQKICDMRLIDFAHAKWCPGEGPDLNVLEGAQAVLKILDQLVPRKVPKD